MRAWMLLSCLIATSALAADEVLAVLPFAVHSEDPGAAYLGGGVADMLVTDLQRGEGIRLVERTRIQELLDELSLQATDFVDPSTAQRIGQGLGATDLVMGSVTLTGDRMRIDARLISVQTGEARLADQAEGDPKTFFKLERALALRLLTHLDVKVNQDARAYFEGADPAPAVAKRAPAPSGGARTTIELGKKVGRTHVFVDGVSIGEHRRRHPLAPIDVAVGDHELALADESGAFMACYGVVSAPRTGLSFAKRADLCDAVQPEADPPYTTLRKGARLTIGGTECMSASMTVGDTRVPGACGTLNLEPGLVQVLLEKSYNGQHWACSGYVNVVPDSHESLTITGGGCHGFHQPGVVATEGPRTWWARLSKAKAAADKAEREARMAD